MGDITIEYSTTLDKDDSALESFGVGSDAVFYVSAYILEACDDGNLWDGDGCSETCTIEPCQVLADGRE